jgi:hypothetical protein
MRANPMLLALGLGVTLSGCLLADDGPGKCPPYADGGKYDASPIVDAIDADKDGRMTHEEWQAAEAPEPSWNMFNQKDKVRQQGYITREDFLTDTPPNGIDTNCDGRITLGEFLATKKWKTGGPPGDPPPKS